MTAGLPDLAMEASPPAEVDWSRMPQAEPPAPAFTTSWEEP